MTRQAGTQFWTCHSLNAGRSLLRTLRHATLLIGLGAHCVLLDAQQTGAPQYRNPVVPGDYPDPSILRVGRDYWATMTSGDWGPYFPLFRSRDLVNWEQTGAVFAHRPAWASGSFWAPEISQFKGRYFVYYTARKRSGPLAVAVATANSPGGPYTDHGPLVAQEAGSIDAVPVLNEAGERYLIWKEDGNSRRLPTVLWAQQLSEDGLKLMGKPQEILRNQSPWEGDVVEGPFVVRRSDYFYLFYSGSGCCGSGCSYALGVARSKSLLGPWEKNPGNPILAENSDWKCPGHGSIAPFELGRYFLLYHSYHLTSALATGRQSMLDEVVFGDNGWPSINEGRGPSSQARSPAGTAQRRATVTFFDDFQDSTLRPGWQWPQDNEPRVALSRSRLGQLVLRPGPEKASDVMDGVLARPAVLPDYQATTVIDVSSLTRGVFAGIAAYSDANHAMGLAAGDGNIRLWRREQSEQRTLNDLPAPAGTKLHLRLISQGGRNYSFGVSVDGKQWKRIGSLADVEGLPPWQQAVRVALTVGGAAGAEARFDSIKIEPLLPR